MYQRLVTLAAAAAMILGTMMLGSGLAAAQDAEPGGHHIEILGPAVPATDNWAYLNDVHGGLAAVEVPVTVTCPRGELVEAPWAGLTDYFPDGHLAEPFMMAHAAPTLIRCTGAPQREVIRASTIHNRQFATCGAPQYPCREAEFFTPGPATFHVQLGVVAAPLATAIQTIEVVADGDRPAGDDAQSEDPPSGAGDQPSDPGDEPPLQDPGTPDRPPHGPRPDGMPVEVPGTPQRLTDIAQNVHHAAIASLVARGVVAGHPDGSFRPAALVTRGQVASLVHRALGLPPAACSSVCSFTDIAPEGAHAGAVESLAATGVLRGVGDGRFAPDEPVTRGQLATILHGVRAWAPAGPVPADYPDVGRIHAEGIRALQAAEIAHGYPDGTFRPSAPLRRDQAASLLYRALDLAG